MSATIRNDKKKDKLIWKEISEIRKQYGMSEYSFHADVKKMQKHFSDNIDAFTSQKIATNLWKMHMINFSMKMEKRYIIKSM